MTTTATLEPPVQRVDIQTLELTSALKRLAQRYFSDTEFRLNLHHDAPGTLAKAEILLTDLEMATVMSYLSSPLVVLGSQRLTISPGEVTSSYHLSPFMANSWGADR